MMDESQVGMQFWSCSRFIGMRMKKVFGAVKVLLWKLEKDKH